jgi:hypothetical protein
VADEQWAVTVTLSNRDVRVLVNSSGTLEEAKANLDAFIKNEKPFRGDWVGAEDVWVARAHVVAASVVQLSVEIHAPASPAMPGPAPDLQD